MTYREILSEIQEAEQTLSNFEQVQGAAHLEAARQNQAAVEIARTELRKVRNQKAGSVPALYSLLSDPRYQPSGPLLPERVSEWVPAVKAQADAVSAAAHAYHLLSDRNTWSKSKDGELRTIGGAASFGALYAFLVWVLDPGLIFLTALLAGAVFAAGAVTRSRGSVLFEKVSLWGLPRDARIVGGALALGTGLFMASWNPPGGALGYFSNAGILDHLAHSLVSIGALPGMVLLGVLAVKLYHAKKQVRLDAELLRAELGSGTGS